MSDSRIDAAIAEFLQAAETGTPPERDAWLAKYPDLRGELEQFLADRSAFRRAAEPLDPDKTMAPVTEAANDSHIVRYFGDYELLEEIARGGMGVVWKARQVSLNRLVAVKMILAGQLAGEADVSRFKAEAEAAANLDHPNILPIYEVGTHERQNYFSMKLVEGGSLADWIKDNVLVENSMRRGEGKSAIAVVQILVKVARAVHHAHQRGILHRDLKPANVLLQYPPHLPALASRASTPKPRSPQLQRLVAMERRLRADSTNSKMDPTQAVVLRSLLFLLRPFRESDDAAPMNGKLPSAGEPGPPQPFVADFGLVKRFHDDSNGIESGSPTGSASAVATRPGAIVGTPAYMAPEQARGGKSVTVASDVFGLGAILYEALTGQAPFAAESSQAALSRSCYGEVTPPHRLQPDIDTHLEGIVFQCLSADPAKRYDSAAAFADDLDRWLIGDPVSAAPLRTTRWERRTAWFGVTLAVLSIILVALTYALDHRLISIWMALNCGLIMLARWLPNPSWAAWHRIRNRSSNRIFKFIIPQLWSPRPKVLLGIAFDLVYGFFFGFACAQSLTFIGIDPSLSDQLLVAVLAAQSCAIIGAAVAAVKWSRPR
jgi:serine/threonine protein kinase